MCFPACDMPPACSHHIWLQHQACNAYKTKAVYDSKLSRVPCSGQACFAGTAASSKLSRCQDCLLSVPQANTQSSHHRQPIAYQSLCVDHACTTSKAFAFSNAYHVLTQTCAIRPCHIQVLKKVRFSDQVVLMFAGTQTNDRVLYLVLSFRGRSYFGSRSRSKCLPAFCSLCAACETTLPKQYMHMHLALAHNAICCPKASSTFA